MKIGTLRPAASLVLILGLLSVVFGQDTDDELEATLPDSVMSEVVARVLITEFANGEAPDVPIAVQNIKVEWLPYIANVSFTMVTESELNEHKDGVYFFRKPEQLKNSWQIHFGRGDPRCKASGDTWSFELVGNNVREFQDVGTWDSNCSYCAGG
jgi:hypothetical protein